VFPDSADLNGDGRSATAQDLAFMVDDFYRGGPVPPDQLTIQAIEEERSFR